MNMLPKTFAQLPVTQKRKRKVLPTTTDVTLGQLQQEVNPASTRAPALAPVLAPVLPTLANHGASPYISLLTTFPPKRAKTMTMTSGQSYASKVVLPELNLQQLGSSNQDDELAEIDFIINSLNKADHECGSDAGSDGSSDVSSSGSWSPLAFDVDVDPLDCGLVGA